MTIIILVGVIGIMLGGALGFWGRKSNDAAYIAELEIGIEGAIFDKNELIKEIKDLKREMRKNLRSNTPKVDKTPTPKSTKSRKK